MNIVWLEKKRLLKVQTALPFKLRWKTHVETSDLCA
jgi:hypothetical protein